MSRTKQLRPKGLTDDEWSKRTFWTYFNVADEIYQSLKARKDQTKPFENIFEDGLTLADLDERFVKEAREGAKLHNLSWPPYLPEAEEYALDHHAELRK